MKRSVAGHPNPIIADDVSRIVSAIPDWRSLARRTVLVTGANGFLPAYIVEVLLSLAELGVLNEAEVPRVIALTRNERHARLRFAHRIGSPGLEILVQDVCDPLPPHVRPDYIIHAASPASPKFYRDDPVGTINPNTLGTAQLLERAAETEAEGFLFFSTSEIYGMLPDGAIPTPEDAVGVLDPIDPRSCYAEAKRLGEALCVAWQRQFGVPSRIVRPFHVYGPGMRLDDGRVFADFVADVLAGRDIKLMSAGTATRSFCYLSDATEGLFRIILLGADAVAYNLGHPEGETSISDLANIIAGLYPEKGLSVSRAVREAGSSYLPSPIERSCPDISRLQAIGWTPTTGVAEGFRRTIDSFAFGGAA
jgi:UDP-glucuronate decarboxylase